MKDGDVVRHNKIERLTSDLGHSRPKSTIHVGSTADIADGPVRADTVEKVENRTTPKISQILIFGQLRR
jgi:hypothetical protein